MLKRDLAFRNTLGTHGNAPIVRLLAFYFDLFQEAEGHLQ